MRNTGTRAFYTAILLMMILIAGCSRFETVLPFMHERVDGTGLVAEEAYFIPDILSPEKLGHTEMMIAAFFGETGEISRLIRAGEAVNQTDNMGMTALHYASAACQTEVVRLLRREGANLKVVDNAGQNAVHKAAKGGCAGLVHVLTRLGINHELQDKSGVSPMMIAAANHDYHTVSVLLENQAHPDLRDNRRRTALHHAVMSMEIVDPPSGEEEEEPEEAGAQRWVSNQSDWIRIPLQYPVDAGVWTWRGLRDYDYSRLNPFGSGEKEMAPPEERVVELLIEYGADPHIADEDLATALEYARARNREDVAERLE